MSYYQPQAGDYYGRGDPGFLSDVWKKIKKPVKVIGSYLLGGVPMAMSTAASFGAQQPTTGFPGGMPLAQIGPPQPANGAMAVNGCCASGYHLDKRTGTKCVRNRRMDVCNARALRRSMRRVSGFEKLAKRTIQFTRRVKLKK